MGNKTPLSPDRPTRRALTADDEARVMELLAAGVNLEVVAVQFRVHSNTIRNLRKRNAGLATTAPPVTSETNATAQHTAGGEAA